MEAGRTAADNQFHLNYLPDCTMKQLKLGCPASRCARCVPLLTNSSWASARADYHYARFRYGLNAKAA
jgi:hypothetical protein